MHAPYMYLKKKKAVEKKKHAYIVSSYSCMYMCVCPHNPNAFGLLEAFGVLEAVGRVGCAERSFFEISLEAVGSAQPEAQP